MKDNVQEKMLDTSSVVVATSDKVKEEVEEPMLGASEIAGTDNDM